MTKNTLFLGVSRCSNLASPVFVISKQRSWRPDIWICTYFLFIYMTHSLDFSLSVASFAQFLSDTIARTRRDPGGSTRKQRGDWMSRTSAIYPKWQGFLVRGVSLVRLDWYAPPSAILLPVQRQSVALPASVYLSPTFSSSSLGLGGGHTAWRRPGVRSSLSVGDATSACWRAGMGGGHTWKESIFHNKNLKAQCATIGRILWHETRCLALV